MGKQKSKQERIMELLRINQADYFYLLQVPAMNNGITIEEVIADRFHDGVKYQTELYERNIEEALGDTRSYQ